MKGERGVIFLQLEYFSILFFVLRDRYYIQYFEAKQHDFLIHKTKSQVAIMKQIGILIHELCVVPILICHNIQPVTRSRSCQEATSISCRSCWYQGHTPTVPWPFHGLSPAAVMYLGAKASWLFFFGHHLTPKVEIVCWRVNQRRKLPCFSF